MGKVNLGPLSHDDLSTSLSSRCNWTSVSANTCLETCPVSSLDAVELLPDETTHPSHRPWVVPSLGLSLSFSFGTGRES